MRESESGSAAPAVNAALRRGFKLKLVPQEAENAPLVILLGWYGCQDRYLAKYGSLVGQLGFSQFRAIIPVEHIWWPWDGGRVKFTRMLMDVLLETGLCPQRKVVLYAFSNGGAFVVEEMYKLFRSNPKYAPVQQSVAGIVFDSAPSYIHASVLHKSTLLTVKDSYPRWALPILWLIIWLVTGFILGLSLLLDGFRPTRKVQYWSYMREVDFGVPQAYLYSKRDELCDSDKLEGLIAGRKARGEDLDLQCWEDTVHVGHYKRHPEQYSTVLGQFLSRITGVNASPAERS